MAKQKQPCEGAGRKIALNTHEYTFKYGTCPECGRENLRIEGPSYEYDEDLNSYYSGKVPNHSVPHK